MLNMNNSREQLRCSRRGCSYTTNRAYNLERHERNHAKGKVPVSQCQPCPHCTYAAGSLHNLMRHISKKHVGVSVKIKAKWSSSPRPGRNKEEPPDTDVSRRHAETQEQREQHLRSYSSLWAWSTPQQQEINFLRRSGLKNECEIHGQTIKLSKLYSLVKTRGGASNVEDWDDIAIALRLPPEFKRTLRSKYMSILHKFEKKEEERIQDQETDGLPPWWDDGNYVSDIDSPKYLSGEEYTACRKQTLSTSVLPVRNSVVKSIYNKYYISHASSSTPFIRFPLKDSWLKATLLSYQSLRTHVHCKQFT